MTGLRAAFTTAGVSPDIGAPLAVKSPELKMDGDRAYLQFTAAQLTNLVFPYRKVPKTLFVVMRSENNTVSDNVGLMSGLRSSYFTGDPNFWQAPAYVLRYFNQ